MEVPVRVRDRNAVVAGQTAIVDILVSVDDVNDNAPKFGADMFEEEIFENNPPTEFWFPASDPDQIKDWKFRLKEENPYVSVG